MTNLLQLGTSNNFEALLFVCLFVCLFGFFCISCDQSVFRYVTTKTSFPSEPGNEVATARATATSKSQYV